MGLETWGIDLLAWDAWAPGLDSKAAWQDWLAGGETKPRNLEKEVPLGKKIPPRSRRRCSAASLMALETGLSVCDQAETSGANVNLIYCSRNGELVTLRNLLEDLCVNEPLSPTKFSNSVHHTPTGYFSLITKNHRISRTISGGDDCFVTGLLETVSLHKKDPETPVLLFYCDEFVPPPFNEMLEKPEFPFSVAMLLKRNQECPEFSLVYDNQLAAQPQKELQPDPIFKFLAWLYDAKGPHRIQTSFGGLTWKP